MIAIPKQEELLTIPEASRELPGRPACATIYRWISHGTRGIKLKATRLGGKTFIARQAVIDFIVACSATAGVDRPAPTHKQRSAAIAAAERELQAA